MSELKEKSKPYAKNELIETGNPKAASELKL